MSENSEQERSIRQEIVDLIKQANRARQEEISLSATLVESIKESLNITRGRNTTDTFLLNINREINRSIINQKEGLSNIDDITKQIVKNNETVNKAKRITNSLSQNLSKYENDRLDISRQLLKKREKIDELLEEEIAKAEAGEPFSQAKIKGLIQQAKITEELIAQDISKLNSSQQQVLLTEANTKSLQRQTAEREKEKQILEDKAKALEAEAEAEKQLLKDIEKNIGLAGAAVKALGKIPGLDQIFKASDIEDVKNELVKAKSAGDKFQIAGDLAKKSFGNLKKTLQDPVFLFTAITEALVRNSKLTNQFQQELGVSYSNAQAMRQQLANAADSSGDLFINSEKLQKSFFALKETTGVFFDLSSQSAETFTNLTERIGLAANEAGNLTMLMRLQGKATEDNLENMYDTTGAMLETSKTTASVKDILGDVAKSSKGLQASLAANPQALAKAAIAAREFGATLADLEKTQSALLDFEKSIEAEMTAELLTGKQLNLEKARAAALNNDMATLGEELKKQNIDLASFGKMNVKQQEAMAEAMGMNRDTLGETLLKQEMQNKSLSEIRETMGEQAYEQAKALDASQKTQAAMTKLKDIFANLMTAFTPIIDGFALLLQPIAFIGKLLGGLSKLTGGWSSKLLGAAVIIKMFGISFGGLKKKIMSAFSPGAYKGFFDGLKGRMAGLTGKGKGGLVNRVKGALGGMNKAGAAAGAAGKGVPKGNPFGFLKKVDTKKLLAGAAAMLIVSAALFVTAKALQEFGSVSWESIAMAGVALLGLTAALAAIGAIMMSGVGAVAIIAGAGAMLIMASALAVLGVAIQGIGKGFAILAPTLSALAPMATDILMLAGAVAALGGAFGVMGVGAMTLMPALPALAMLAGLGAAAATVLSVVGGGGGAQSPGGGGAGIATAEAGGTSGEEIRAIVEETVTATINALVPEMVSALREGIGNITVSNNNFNNSRQSEGPSRNRNITNNNFA